MTPPPAPPLHAGHATGRPSGPGPELPAALGRLLRRLPAYPGSVLLSNALNLVLARQLAADVLAALQGRHVRIEVTDAQLGFDFAWQGQRFIALPAPGSDAAAPDLRIAASLADFYRLTQQQVDPDTLFFSRRLKLEGDTELGLMVKNALDALELPRFSWAALSPSAVLQTLCARLPTTR